MDLEVDLAIALEDIEGITGVYALPPVDHPDAYAFAIVLDPYSQRTLVEAHYAIVSATDTRSAAGRVFYVSGAMPMPTPIARVRCIAPTPQEAAAARKRIASRRAQHDGASERIALEETFRKFAADVFEADRPTEGWTMEKPPYRGAGVSFDLRTRVLEVVRDPFPSSPRPRILVIDEDDDTATNLRRELDVTHVDEGWAAIEAIEKGEYDAVLCALRVGATSGASLHRMIVKTRPALAARIAFVASARVVASALPSSALGRVLARPVTVDAVRRLLA